MRRKVPLLGRETNLLVWSTSVRKKDEKFSFPVVFLFSKNLFLPTTVTKKSLEMVGSKSNQHILVVKSARHLRTIPDQAGFTHPQSSSCSSDSGHSGRHIESDTGGNQAGLVQLPEKAARVNGEKYLYKGNVCMWRNGCICCEHGRQKSQCKDCHGR